MYPAHKCQNTNNNWHFIFISPLVPGVSYMQDFSLLVMLPGYCLES